MAKLNGLDSLKSLLTEEEVQAFDKKHEEELANKAPDFGTSKLHIQYERKGRGGKEVCVISGFDTDEQTIKDFAKQVKSHCGLGGSVKNGEIIMQGKAIDKIEQFLIKKGFKVTRNK